MDGTLYKVLPASKSESSIPSGSVQVKIEPECYASTEDSCDPFQIFGEYLNVHDVKFEISDDVHDVKFEISDDPTEKASCRELNTQTLEIKEEDGVRAGHLNQTQDQTYKNQTNNKSYQTYRNRNKNHICDICQYSFKSFVELTVHKRTHIKKHKFMCVYCEQYFDRCNEGQSIYNACANCLRSKIEYVDSTEQSSEGADNEKSVENYIKTHRCQYCNGLFLNLKRHTLQTHKLRNDYACHKCNRLFKYSTDFKGHVMQCINSEIISEISRQLRSKTYTRTAKKKTHACSVCQETFDDVVSLNCHIMTHTVVDDKPAEIESLSLQTTAPDKNINCEIRYDFDDCHIPFTPTEDLEEVRRIHYTYNTPQRK